MTGVGFSSQANTNIKALKFANEYCTKIGKHMVPVTSAIDLGGENDQSDCR
jgi:hypothetical protein